MRLIDADKLKVYLQEYLHYGHAIPWVDAQPTAYDVEKVVAELEEEKYTREEKFQYDTRTQEKMSSYNMGLNKAISVVKRGGEK